MEWLYKLLSHSEPMLLFVVIGLGYLLGEVRIRGFKLGVAGVLFAGLAFGAWHPAGEPSFKVAHSITELGLILFVYGIGLTTGPGFIGSLRRKGLRYNAATFAGLMAGALVTLLGGLWLKLSPGLSAGAFCGGLTNTPALAAVTQLLNRTSEAASSEPALGYSIAYPYGVLGGLISFHLFLRFSRRSFQQEQEESAKRAATTRHVAATNFEITNPEILDKAIGELRVNEETGLIISRIRHASEVSVPNKYTRLEAGDIVLAVGTVEDLERAETYFGRRSQEHLEFDRKNVEMRRILLSEKKLAGERIKDLELDRRFNAQITRVRRADIDVAADPDMRLQVGDRLRVVAPRDQMSGVSKFFGDSERHVAELDYIALTMGIVLGVLLGSIPIPLPGGNSITLGFAGGPLLMGIYLGHLGKTGPLVWSIPHESNQVLRHIGLLIFLSGVGVMAGGRFLSALQDSGAALLVLGFVVTTVSNLVALLLLRLWAHSPVVGTLGATSGMQTQPATLEAARELTGSDEVYVAYATTYPLAMIGKIVLAQVIVIVGMGL